MLLVHQQDELEEADILIRNNIIDLTKLQRIQQELLKMYQILK